MDKRNFAFDKVNFMLLAIGVVVVIIGFLLMSGSGSTETAYNPDIFSVRRMYNWQVVAPRSVFPCGTPLI